MNLYPYIMVNFFIFN